MESSSVPKTDNFGSYPNAPVKNMGSCFISYNMHNIKKFTLLVITINYYYKYITKKK